MRLLSLRRLSIGAPGGVPRFITIDGVLFELVTEGGAPVTEAGALVYERA
jgi:hypothetical protein